MIKANEIISKLTAKDDKYACAIADKIISESQETDQWYEYFNDFASLLNYPKSLVINRVLYILAANAQWDVDNRFDAILDDYLDHVTDEKPITARQCIKALAQVGKAKPQYIPKILSCLDNADLSKYKDSMRPLIEKDIAETEKVLRFKSLVIYVHGKGGSAEEATHYRPLFADSDVIGFDYKSQNPWEAKSEFSQYFDLHSKGYDSVILIANSIGALLSMYALAGKKISQAMFISPIVNMEKLITDMMTWSNVTEDELQRKKEILTAFGETLSWEYLCYVRKHPIEWSIPTCILYGEKDNLTSLDTIHEFTDKTGAALTVMKDGEHWFHTDAQMTVLDNWIVNSI